MKSLHLCAFFFIPLFSGIFFCLTEAPAEQTDAPAAPQYTGARRHGTYAELCGIRGEKTASSFPGYSADQGDKPLQGAQPVPGQVPGQGYSADRGEDIVLPQENPLPEHPDPAGKTGRPQKNATTERTELTEQTFSSQKNSAPEGSAISGALTPEGQHLVVRNHAGTVVFSRIFPDGGRFGVRFIHSVAKSPVIDWFVARQGGICLDSTVYQDFGAGLPHTPGPGQTMAQRDGHVIISGYNMRLPQLDVRVGRIAQHTLLLPETWESVPLNTLAPPGAALTFSLTGETQPGRQNKK